MKIAKKLLVLLGGMSFSLALWANTVPTCAMIKGVYTGTYTDPTGLFPSGNFPIKMYLTYQNDMIYGYTLKTKDQKGAKYGVKPYALVWGTCQHNQLSNLYVIKPNQTPCGSPAAGPMTVNSNGSIDLTINYENAMINANLQATLSPNRSKDKQVKQDRLDQAMALAKTGVQTCH